MFADGNERISAARIAGLRMLIRADMHARAPRRPADVVSNERVATNEERAARVLYASK